MISLDEVIETNEMVQHMNFDVRTITMGISLLDCVGKGKPVTIYITRSLKRLRIWLRLVRR